MVVTTTRYLLAAHGIFLLKFNLIIVYSLRRSGRTQVVRDIVREVDEPCERLLRVGLRVVLKDENLCALGDDDAFARRATRQQHFRAIRVPTHILPQSTNVVKL